MPRMILESQAPEMATPAQLSLLRSLAGYKDTGTMDIARIDANPVSLSKKEASAGIDWLKGRPNAAPSPIAPPKRAPKVQARTPITGPDRERKPTEPGYYLWPTEVTGEGDVYLRVIVNVKSERLNYHVRPPSTWEYRKGAQVDALVRQYGEPERMTVEQIAAYGHTSLTCLCCGRDLSNPESLARGLGPDCFAKYGGLGMF